VQKIAAVSYFRVLSGHIQQHRTVCWGVLQKMIAGSENNSVISSSSTSQQLTQMNVLQFNMSLLWLSSSIKRLPIDLPGNIRDCESVWHEGGFIAASTTVLWTTKSAADAT
jgi:hypothetical protein